MQVIINDQHDAEQLLEQGWGVIHFQISPPDDEYLRGQHFYVLESPQEQPNTKQDSSLNWRVIAQNRLGEILELVKALREQNEQAQEEYATAIQECDAARAQVAELREKLELAESKAAREFLRNQEERDRTRKQERRAIVALEKANGYPFQFS